MRITTIHTRYANNYLVENGKQTILIDCSVDLRTIKKLTNKIDAIIITHGHFDHFFTLEEILEEFDAKVYMHKNAFLKLSNKNQNASKTFGLLFECNVDMSRVEFVKEGQNNIAGLDCNIYYAFGHTNDSILIEIGKALFTGDFVFENTYGRTDLPTGNFAVMQQNLQKYQKLISSHQCYYGH